MSKPGELFAIAAILVSSAGSFGWLASLDHDHRGLLIVSAAEAGLAIAALVRTSHGTWRKLRAWSIAAIAAIVLVLLVRGRHAFRADLMLRDENTRLTLVLAGRAVLFALAFALLGREGVRKRFPPPFAVE
ncbi:MAG: hypothetical protein HYV09_25315 [Deltaproteobacteria bacterium]|nr:hypothetical protein [Deltaproteobacteria bacterium]